MKKQNDKDKKEKGKFLGIFSTITAFLFPVAWIIIQSYIGNGNSTKYFIVLVIIIVAAIYITFVIMSLFLIYGFKLSNSFGINVPYDKKCRYFNTICCVNLAIDSLKSAYKIRLDDNVATKYGLYTEEQLIERESKLNQGEVWIVSYDLTAEALENQQARIRERNIKKGIKYRLFYINDDTQKYGELQDNIKILDERYNKKMKLYPYEKPISIFSFLFSLFGIIMLIDENGLVKESYFTLYSSNDKIKEPIYIEMSYCMEKKYSKILYSIKDTARNPREKRSKNRIYSGRKRIKKRFQLLNFHKNKGGK